MSFQVKSKWSPKAIHQSISPGIDPLYGVEGNEFEGTSVEEIPNLPRITFAAVGIEAYMVPKDKEWDKQHPSHRRIRYWLKCTGKIEDPKAHVMGLGYLSDSLMLSAAPYAGGFGWSDISMIVSLDHSIYFHRQPKADEWLLNCLESPWSGSQRGLVISKFFAMNGEHVATVIQEGVVRLNETAMAKI